MFQGFDAYCGFMHVESTHTNPVAMVFISILQAESLTALKRKEKKILNIVLRGEFFLILRPVLCKYILINCTCT